MELSVRALWVWAPAVLLMALIYFLSSLSEIPAPPGGMSYTGVHAVVYGVLGILVLRAAAGARWSGVTAGRVAIAVVVTGSTAQPTNTISCLLPDALRRVEI